MRLVSRLLQGVGELLNFVPRLDADVKNMIANQIDAAQARFAEIPPGALMPRTVNKRYSPKFLGTLASQHVLRHSPGGVASGLGPADDGVVNRSIYNTRSTPRRDQEPGSLAACFRPFGMPGRLPGHC
jgi:hypothetical protein